MGLSQGTVEEQHIMCKLGHIQSDENSKIIICIAHKKHPKHPNEREDFEKFRQKTSGDTPH